MSVNSSDIQELAKITLSDWNSSELVRSPDPANRIKAHPYVITIQTSAQQYRSSVELSIGKPGVEGAMSISLEIDEGIPRVHFYNDDGDPLCSVKLSPSGAIMDDFLTTQSIEVNQPSFDSESWKAKELEDIINAEAEIAAESNVTSPSKSQQRL